VDGRHRLQLTRRIKLRSFRRGSLPHPFEHRLRDPALLEPQVLGLATEGTISPQYTPNQLSYTFAFSDLRRPGGCRAVGDAPLSQPGDRRHNHDPHRSVQCR